MVGFISEFLVFRGSFPVFPLQTLLCMVGTGLTAVYFLLLVNRSFFGRLTTRLEGKEEVLPRVFWRDRLPAVLLAVLIILFGLQPNWLVSWAEPTITALSNAQTMIVQPRPITLAINR
jgi:NAD(P)H-quinone oxidoreductase subunit 4